MNKQTIRYEAEVIEGLEFIAQAEIARLHGTQVVNQHKGAVLFDFESRFAPLLNLRAVTAVWRSLTFDVPRPKALLGHQHFARLNAAILDVLKQHPPHSFTTLSIDAAGSESSVMRRACAELAQSVNLTPSDDRGDMVIRLRRAGNGTGWDALIRITPRPLVTRDWRVCNYEGALNASIAYAMTQMLNPRTDDVFLNAACGSGSLLIERLVSTNAALAVGVDLSLEALTCARQNLAATQINIAPSLILANLHNLPFNNQTFNVLCADLPFGQLVGSHESNRSLYPAALSELGRVAQPQARLALITHEVRLMETVLGKQHAWQLDRTVTVTQRGLHPRIYLLHKVSLV